MQIRCNHLCIALKHASSSRRFSFICVSIAENCAEITAQFGPTGTTVAPFEEFRKACRSPNRTDFKCADKVFMLANGQAKRGSGLGKFSLLQHLLLFQIRFLQS